MSKYLTFAKSLSLKAGETIKKYFKSDIGLNYKSDKDFTLKADLEAEKLIINEINKNFPSHSILSEEAGATDNNSKYKWVIDPIDGTANFRAGLPNFCTSIALQYNHKIIVAAIYFPFFKEMFYAEKGNGSFRNGEKIFVSKEQNLKQFFVAYATSNHKNQKAIDLGSTAFKNILQHCRAVRLSGSSLFDLCHLANGTFDALIKVQASYWDFASGCLIVEEAGGRVTDWTGNLWSEDTIDLAATNSKIHQQFLNILC